MYIDDMEVDNQGRPKKLYKGKLLTAQQIWYRENIAHVREYQKTLNKSSKLGRPFIYNTPEEVRAGKVTSHLKYQRGKGKIYHRWRDLIKTTLLRLNQSKNDTTHNLLKYTAIELNEHLLSLDYNKDIHDIDHRIPVSWFRDDTPPHIVNHLSNIHPLNKKDNIIKGNRFAHSVEEAYYHEVFPFIKNTYQQRIYINE